ncbi:hypothetical protein Syun_025880 [Stephania yunnanensis]|uniref:Uncharacterized protein n=1 Tax=Stephania yunnanensis TaxID=152371 RepID=A0AAP0HWJ2_9MAGN
MCIGFASRYAFRETRERFSQTYKAVEKKENDRVCLDIRVARISRTSNTYLQNLIYVIFISSQPGKKT